MMGQSETLSSSLIIFIALFIAGSPAVAMQANYAESKLFS
jgi:hypothetical protein